MQKEDLGLFITFEGGEGSGKTTIIEKVCDYLEEINKDYILTREPGGTNISEQIRNVILDRKNTEMDGLTEAYLYAASRNQHMTEKVIPALKENKIVMSDRFVDSSIVYQGYVRGFGMDTIFNLNKDAIFHNNKYWMPDLTIYFDLEPEIGLSRIAKNKNREVNRLDLEKIDFHNKVREGYLKWAKENPNRIKIIDASKTIEEVAQDVIQLIKEKIEEK